uniref:Set2 Rpb1 interacting domain-containing protein n=1 Tax=Anopheles maculatus TaxID=74869 RepID=A0A182T0Z2_9DIPT
MHLANSLANKASLPVSTIQAGGVVGLGGKPSCMSTVTTTNNVPVMVAAGPSSGGASCNNSNAQQLMANASGHTPGGAPDSAGSTPSGSQLAEMEKKKKNLASCVIHYLMPYYRDQKIETKELFKGLARKISHKFYEADVTAERKVKKYIDDMMAHKGIISSEADFPK